MSVPDGSAVTTWGQTPEGIELALALWVLSFISGGGHVVASGALKSETTDNYKWERFEPSTSSVTGEITGNPLADRILMQYVSPPKLDFI